MSTNQYHNTQQSQPGQIMPSNKYQKESTLCSKQKIKLMLSIVRETSDWLSVKEKHVSTKHEVKQNRANMCIVHTRKYNYL